MAATPKLSSAAQVTGLSGFYRHGQVFLTWTNAGNQDNFYKAYRSLTPIAHGSQLANCEYLGWTNQFSAKDNDLTAHYNQNYYLRIDSAGTPLPSSKGLFVATTLADGEYYYAVTVILDGTEDITIIPGVNSTSQPFSEQVSVPQPVFQQTINISGKPIELYTNFISFKKEIAQPPINAAGWIATDFLVNRNNNTGNQPLVIRMHGGGTDFFAQIENVSSNEMNLNVEQVFANGERGGYWGANSNYNIFEKDTTVPSTGMNHNFFQEAYEHTIDWAINHLNIDSNRIYLRGSSAGACGAFVFSMAYPEKIAAVHLGVPCFNVGFQNDSVPGNSLNPGGKNRVDIDELLGKVSTNLPSNLGYNTFDILNGAWAVHQFPERDYPFIYAINGKADESVGWTEKPIYYDSINANAIGGYYFWDSRAHGGALGFWNDDNFDLFRFRRNVSYPAFSNCSLNEDYGNGSLNSGDNYGTVNGSLDWKDNIVDSAATWRVSCFLRNLSAQGNQVVVYPDSATVDIAPRRLQQFHPPLNAVISWSVIHDQQMIQSGSQIYHGGTIVVRDVKVFKDTIQFQLNYSTADTFYADADLDGFGNPDLFAFGTIAPAGYVFNNTDCNDSDALIHPFTTETCNSTDDNCDGQIDEAVQSVFYADADADGYGNANSITLSCSAPVGYVSDSTDCNDSHINVHPFNTETCNGFDDNCDGQIDEGVVTSVITPSGNVTVCQGSSIELQANTGIGLTYQWKKDENNIPGATASYYAVSESASYSVTVISGSCSSTSAATVLVVNALPVATVTPSVKIKTCPETVVTFQANTGEGLTYQWKSSGVEIPGATNSSYITSVVGNYKVVVKNSEGCSKKSTTTSFTNYAPAAPKLTVVGNLNICETGSVQFNGKIVIGYLYQWYKDDAPINGATDSFYIATTPGTYKYFATTKNGCSKYSDTKIVTGCKIGNADSDPVSIAVFPNPTNGYFNVHFDLKQSFTGEAMLSITNTLGQVVYLETAIVTDGILHQVISLNTGAAGIYWLKVVTNENTFTAPVSINR